MKAWSKALRLRGGSRDGVDAEGNAAVGAFKWRISLSVKSAEDLPDTGSSSTVVFVWSRGNKTCMSKPTDVDELSRVMHVDETMQQLATIRKLKSGKMQEKIFSFKIQSLVRNKKGGRDTYVTVAKAHVDLASYCVDESPKVLKIPLQPGGTLHCTLNCSWLRNADADAASDLSGTNNSEVTASSAPQRPGATVAKVRYEQPQEQDLEGFDDDFDLNDLVSSDEDEADKDGVGGDGDDGAHGKRAPKNENVEPPPVAVVTEPSRELKKKKSLSPGKGPQKKKVGSTTAMQTSADGLEKNETADPGAMVDQKKAKKSKKKTTAADAPEDPSAAVEGTQLALYGGDDSRDDGREKAAKALVVASPARSKTKASRKADASDAGASMALVLASEGTASSSATPTKEKQAGGRTRRGSQRRDADDAPGNRAGAPMGEIEAASSGILRVAELTTLLRKRDIEIEGLHGDVEILQDELEKALATSESAKKLRAELDGLKDTIQEKQEREAALVVEGDRLREEVVRKKTAEEEARAELNELHKSIDEDYEETEKLLQKWKSQTAEREAQLIKEKEDIERDLKFQLKDADAQIKELKQKLGGGLGSAASGALIVPVPATIALSEHHKLIEDRDSRLEELGKKLEESDAALDDARAAAATASSEHAGAMAKLTVHHGQLISSLEEEKSIASERIDFLNSELIAAHDRLDEKSELLDSLSLDYDTQVSKLTSAQRHIADLELKCEDMEQTRAAEANSLRSTADLERNELLLEIATMRDALTDAEKTRETQESELIETKLSLENERRETESLNNELLASQKALEAAILEAKADLESMSESDRRASELEKVLGERGEELGTMRGRLAEAESELESVRDESASLRSQLVEVQSAMARAEAKASQHSAGEEKLEGRVKELEEAIATKSDELREAQDSVDRLTEQHVAELAAAREEAAAIAAKHAETIADVDSTRGQLMVELATLKTSFEESQARIARNEEKLAENADTESRLRAQTERSELLQAQLSSLEEEMAELASDMDHQKQVADDRAQRVQELEASIQQKSEDAAGMRRKQADLENELEKERETSADLSAHLASANANLETLRGRSLQIETDSDAVRNRVSELEKELDERSRSLDATQARLGEAEENGAAETAAIREETSAALATKDDEIEELKMQIEKERTASAGYQAQIATVSASMVALSAQSAQFESDSALHLRRARDLDASVAEKAKALGAAQARLEESEKKAAAEIAGLREESVAALARKDTELEELGRQLEKERMTSAGLQAQVTSANESMLLLSSRSSEFESDTSALRDKIVDLEAAVADKSKALDDALATLEDVRKTSAADAAAVREEADAKLSKSEGEAVLEAEDLRRQIHELEGRIDAQSGKLKAAEDALETMRSSHALELAAAVDEAGRTREESAAAGAAVRVQELEGELEDVRAQLSATKASIDAIEKDNDEKMTLMRDENEMERAGHAEALSKVEMDKSEALAEIAALRDSLRLAEEKAAEDSLRETEANQATQAHAEQIDALEAQLEDERENNLMLLSQLDDMESKLADQEKIGDTEEWRTRALESEKQLAALESSAGVKEMAQAAALKDVAEKEIMITELRATLESEKASASRTSDAYVREIQDLKRQLRESAASGEASAVGGAACIAAGAGGARAIKEAEASSAAPASLKRNDSTTTDGGSDSDGSYDSFLDGLSDDLTDDDDDDGSELTSQTSGSIASLGAVGPLDRQKTITQLEGQIGTAEDAHKDLKAEMETISATISTFHAESNRARDTADQAELAASETMSKLATLQQSSAKKKPRAFFGGSGNAQRHDHDVQTQFTEVAQIAAQTAAQALQISSEANEITDSFERAARDKITRASMKLQTTESKWEKAKSLLRKLTENGGAMDDGQYERAGHDEKELVAALVKAKVDLAEAEAEMIKLKGELCGLRTKNAALFSKLTGKDVAGGAGPQ